MKRIIYTMSFFSALTVLFILSFLFFEYKEPQKAEENDVILTFSGEAEKEYIDKIYFVGDSTTYHFYKGGIERSHLLVPDSFTLKLSSDILALRVGEGSVPIPDAVAESSAEIVILTIGVNGADSFTEKQYKTYYKKLLCAIREKCPETKIIIQSVFPVTQWYSELGLGITNEGIDRINSWGYELAEELGLNYLDTQSILKNSDGAQKLIYSENDGVHINSLGYERIVEYIATHAVE